MTTDIRSLLEPHLPLVDFDSPFLYQEFDSLDITTILMVLSEHYHITLDPSDATPRNLRSLESIAALVQSKCSSQTT